MIIIKVPARSNLEISFRRLEANVMLRTANANRNLQLNSYYLRVR